MEKFEVKNRWSGEVQFVAEIKCDEDAPLSVKLGLAVVWTNLTRANLTGANLTRANLTRTNLTRANLTGANLTRANLTRTNLTKTDLTGANLTGAFMYLGNRKIVL